MILTNEKFSVVFDAQDEQFAFDFLNVLIQGYKDLTQKMRVSLPNYHTTLLICNSADSFQSATGLSGDDKKRMISYCKDNEHIFILSPFAVKNKTYEEVKDVVKIELENNIITRLKSNCMTI